MPRFRHVRPLLAVSVCILLGVPAPGEEPAPNPETVQRQIAGLRNEYRTLLDQGKADEELRNLLRDLNAATSAGDWNRAVELLAKRGGAAANAPADGDGAAPGTDLWPVRTATPTDDGAWSFTMEKVTYEGVGGLKLGALLYRPKPGGQDGTAAPAQSKSPAIVLVHGGFRGVALEYRRLAEALAKVGYVVYAPELRGQGQSEGEVEYGGGEVLDLLSAIEATKALEEVDGNRIGLVGGEHGGLITLLALARAEGVVCAAALSAPTDLAKILRESPLFRRELQLWHITLDLSDPDLLRQRSPLFYASGVQVPVLILHGERDLKVPVELVEGYVAVLQSRKKDATLLRYVTAGDDLPSLLNTYHVDLQNFLAERLKPAGWKVYKKSGQPRGGQGRGGQGGGGRQRGSGRRGGQGQGGEGVDEESGGRRRRN